MSATAERKACSSCDREGGRASTRRVTSAGSSPVATAVAISASAPSRAPRVSIIADADDIGADAALDASSLGGGETSVKTRGGGTGESRLVKGGGQDDRGRTFPLLAHTPQGRPHWRSRP